MPKSTCGSGGDIGNTAPDRTSLSSQGKDVSVSGRTGEETRRTTTPFGVAELSSAACLTIRRPGTPCTACADTCPAEAITISVRDVTISDTTCKGCGRCASACPTGAIELPGFMGTESGPPLRQVHVECRRVAEVDQIEDAISVPCLGGLTPAHLRELVATAQVSLVDRGWCRDCPSGGCPDPWAGALATVHDELALLPEDFGPRHVSVVERLTPSQSSLPPAATRDRKDRRMSRRHFFTRFVEPTPPKPERGLDTTDPLRHLPGKVEVPALVTRLGQLRGLWTDGNLPAALFPEVVVGDQCCDSRVCAGVCPSGALSAQAGGGAETLVFDAALCVGCRACADACPSGAMAYRPAGSGDYTGAIEVRLRRLATCSRCGTEFHPSSDETVCEGCRKDRDLAALAHGLVRRAMAQERPSPVGRSPGMNG